MKTRFFELEHIKKGDVIYMSACSQCSSKGSISIDGPLSNPLVLRKTSDSSDIKPLEGDATAIVTGDGAIRLKVEIDVNKELKVIKSGVLISDRDGKEQGLHFAFDIEDGTDNDFNDYWVSVACWHRRG